MIKCNRCGNMTPAGAVCQACGAPLAGMVENGPAQRMGFQDQPELPAWLESLRAGERSAPPANNPGNFSPADLIEEGALPSWMRSERGDARDNTASNPPVSARPAPQSDQMPASGEVPAQGFTAQSLIDEKSLPSWMQEGKSKAAPDPSAAGSVTASSLIQPDNVPDWMRTLQQQQPAPKSNPVPQQVVPPQAQPPTPSAPSFAAGFSASSLIDQQALPSWMQSQNERGSNTGSSFPINQSQPAQGAPTPGQTGFSASSLIDQQALPSWMQPQNERGSNTGSSFPINQSQPAQGAPIPGQTGFSASSLLDVDALPQWLQEGGKNPGQQSRNNPPAPAVQSAPWSAPSSNVAWPPSNQQPSAGLQSSMQTPPVEGNQLSASSFIDPNALPEWMRSASGQPSSMPSGQQGMNSGARPGAYGVPQRPENMRVPSRPRGEANLNESSELAANVFASMLGVASATPNYPAQQQQQPPMEQPGQGNPFGQNNQPGQANNPFEQTNQGNSFGQSGQGNVYGQMNQPGSMGSQASMGGVPNTPQGMSGVFPQDYAAGNSFSGGYGNNYPGNSQGQGNPAMGGNPSMSGQPAFNVNPPLNAAPPYSGNAHPQSAAPSASSDTAADQKNNKKRGLFEAIREWLSR